MSLPIRNQADKGEITRLSVKLYSQHADRKEAETQSGYPRLALYFFVRRRVTTLPEGRTL
jgi:hypothetical protein